MSDFLTGINNETNSQLGNIFGISLPSLPSGGIGQGIPSTPPIVAPNSGSPDITGGAGQSLGNLLGGLFGGGVGTPLGSILGSATGTTQQVETYIVELIGYLATNAVALLILTFGLYLLLKPEIDTTARNVVRYGKYLVAE